MTRFYIRENWLTISFCALLHALITIGILFLVHSVVHSSQVHAQAVTTLGELRSQTESLPDETAVTIWTGAVQTEVQSHSFNVIKQNAGGSTIVALWAVQSTTPVPPTSTLRYPDGYYLLLNNADLDPATRKNWLSDAMIRHPLIKGVIHRVRWKHLEPTDDKYVLSPHITQLKRYRDAGKQYGFLVMTGDGCTPAWVKGTRVKLPDTSEPVLIPWGSELAPEYAELMQKLGSMQVAPGLQMRHDGRLVSVPITGPTISASQEMFASGLNTVPGYSPNAMRVAYRASTESIKANFPNVCAPLALAVRPPVNQYVDLVISDCKQILGKAAAFQHNALSAKPDLPRYDLHEKLKRMAAQGDRIFFEMLCATNPESQAQRFGSTDVMVGVKQGAFATAWFIYPPDYMELKPISTFQVRSQPGFEQVQ